MGQSLWARFLKRRRDATAERDQERQHMSPTERAFTSESVEDHQADEESKAHLGGEDPNRLLGD